ncbi:coiled-coil domain-containing protein [Anaeromicropila herbilytica]|uniref:Chromosome segregation ATPase n=1 Tax=Anaeromicropila herbilytica TaxID=2785025 RepID=A0A7R7EM36_9FIRM|nr:hypothetical protein [Anaeromicropila herbilytica]BCN31344.1 hypothetical protein bsdtb5_26390 [Anaeromicropila herbilytica]
MSKMNAFRIINLSYNNNGIRIDDEVFQLNGESTLLSLRNGGGKSVLVQMLTAPFVHKRFRDVKERPFSSYFTTNKPTFLIVEWILDGGVGYVMTGMMIRKRQVETEEDTQKDELEIINFISEYMERNEYDIYHLPVLSEGQGTKALKGYRTCLNLFKNLKNDNHRKFFVYDMSVSHQSKNYFNKLEEYQIFSKEWESIIKKVNLKESGLSELFADARDEKGLIDKWFLDAVESKLNKEESRMKEFENIIQKFIIQYKDNKSKIEKKEIITNFEEDARDLLDSATNFSEVIKKKSEIENKLANLSEILLDLKTSVNSDREEHEERIKMIRDEISEIYYDELSYQIYQLTDKKDEINKRQIQFKEQSEEVKSQKIRLERQQHILDCAKLYGRYKEESQDVQLLENQLDLITKEEKDLSEERHQLGYTLRCYYEKEEQSQDGYVKCLESTLSANKERMEEYKGRVVEKEQEQKERIAQKGALSEKIKNYQKIEQSYNQKYNENIGRNILGEYEDSVLELKQQEENNALQAHKKQLVHLKKQKEEKREESHRYSRQLEDNRILIGTIYAKVKNLENEYKDYEKQLTLRKTILQHIGYDESKVFEQKAIMKAFEDKIEKIEDQLRKLCNQEEQLTLEYKRLESGKVFDLPKDLEEALQKEGFHYTFGMEWLKKNGKSEKENKDLVASNPFLPYGIIMSEQDLTRLSKKDLGIFTSFPIPIIKREALTTRQSKEQSIVILNEKVNFYLLFNNNLLDEAGLRLLLDKKLAEIDSTKEDIKRRVEEKSFYKERLELIISQTLTSEKYHNCIRLLENSRREEKEANEKEHALRTNIQQIEELRSRIEEDISKGTEYVRIQEEKVKNLEQLMIEYSEYLEHKKLEQTLIADIQSLDYSIQSDKETIEDLEKEHLNTQSERQHGIAKQKELQDKLKQYIIYDASEIVNRDIEDIKARFMAITSEISSKEKELEDQLEKAKNRFENCEKELIYLTERYHFVQEDYDNIKFDRYEYEELEKESKELESESNKLNHTLMELHGEETSLTARISERYTQMSEKLGKTIIKPREQIIATDFKKLLTDKKHEMSIENEALEVTERKLISYEENLMVLSEYGELKAKEMILEKTMIEAMDKETLNSYLLTLRREYRSLENSKREHAELLNKLLLQVLEKPVYEDEFFKKPLLTLHALSKEPDEFILQLTMTLEAYHQLLEKLEVDIEIIEKEKEKIQEMLLGYIEDVHNNLGKIDKNSTIKVRDRSIKMLRIILPDWKEQVTNYHIRLRDYLEDIIHSAMLRIENNENIEEMIGNQVTTKKLYDTIVGIGNIEIKLYKIEEQREYPITWAEVAKNSGGEGFLSAFIVLSSLLSFMRKEDTDIFSERVQGKVLVMDNPFAQTNAAHLLKPLMDTAKKHNTQLICLSGLGGDSIYNRFDNIYVLNLISSGLRKGMEYLKTEHIKGEEEVQTLTSSYIRTEDMEQMELLF